MAHHDLFSHPLVLRRARVDRVTDVTPRMRRVTLTGDQLGLFHDGEHLHPPLATPAFDDHVKLVFASDGDVAAALPVQRARSIDWPVSETRRGRDYTLRRWDEVRGELDLDFLRHGDGPAAAWAERARPGDELWFAGPKSSLIVPRDVDWVLLAGDETALPAIGRYLDERPLPVPARIVITVASDDARQDLRLGPGDRIDWVCTDRPEDLEQAVRGVEWLPGRPFVWVAGECRSLLPLRSWLRRDRGVPASHTSITGYWHASGTRVPAVRTLLDPMPWLAARALDQLGVLELLDGEATDHDTLAERAGVAVADLRTLTGYLDHAGVLDDGPDGVRTNRATEELLGSDNLREDLLGDGLPGRTLRAAIDLAAAMRTGSSGWRRVFGPGLGAAVAGEIGLYGDRMQDAGSFAYVAAGLTGIPAWGGDVVLRGPGAPSLARAALARPGGPGAGLQICTAGSPGELLADAARSLGLEAAAEPGPCDLLVSTLELEHRDDGEVVDLLWDLHRASSRVVVVDAVTRTGPAGLAHRRQHDLRQLVTTGTGSRDATRYAQLARRAGWEVGATTALGWDYVALDLIR
ncbi:siderophore-interacting protein [Pseudonocardia nematodicida]|uniref:Siderophore-interacting protein n=1 Tax=Pseudonocardia nematodicida TaxID=1206997 RepID=A0ABV1K748_9PSEU